jgi:hypothetical protein
MLDTDRIYPLVWHVPCLMAQRLTADGCTCTPTITAVTTTTSTGWRANVSHENDCFMARNPTSRLW